CRFVAVGCLYSNVCLRRSSSYRRRLWKKFFKDIRKNSTTLENLCYGNEMIDNMTLEANDTIFYRDNAKEFPNGVFYPNCSLPLQLNESSETQTEECVDFIITSSNLSLPDGKNASEPSKRVMWLVINHLCGHSGITFEIFLGTSETINHILLYCKFMLLHIWIIPHHFNLISFI
uniref:Prion/Doppel protein beta-ribbon domain-containing protein n=1 Tax=Pseudonaja textilis TaxID=8673 RepID=A0A670ZD44_PSETE